MLKIIVMILFTLVVVIMCRFFIIDIITYIKKKRYTMVFIGATLIIYFIYSWFKVLFIIIK